MTSPALYDVLFSFKDIHQVVLNLDAKYSDFQNLDEELRKDFEMIRRNLIVFLTHDCHHLGMMECLKGLETGFGSATEKRE